VAALNPLDLRFAPDQRAPLELVFGDDGGGAGLPTYQLTGGGQITGLHGTANLHAAYPLHGSGQLSHIAGGGQISYSSNVQRPLLARINPAAQPAQPVAVRWRSGWELSRPLTVAYRHHWQPARQQAGIWAAHWQATQRLGGAWRPAFQNGLPLLVGASGTFQRALTLVNGQRVDWQLGLPLLTGPRVAFQQTEHRHAARRSHFQPATPLARHWPQPMRVARPLDALRRIAWQKARHPPPGISPRPPGPPRQPWCYEPLLPIDLHFVPDDRAPLALLFICERDGGGTHPELPPATVVVLPRRSTIVINSIEIRRVSNNTLLPSEAFSMSIDRASWTWQWSATFDRAARDAVAPGPDGAPVELEVRINGQPFRLLAERVGRSVRFPERLVKASGRARIALLDAPSAAEQNFGNTAPCTAQQLMEQVLTINGVGIGWSVDWQLTDWVVPGNVWSHYGPWITALADIAGSVGGYLQPHDTDAVVRVLPGWPAPWWEWATATPDLELPAGIAEVEETEWIDKPLYDRVFVGGEAGGILGQYTRAGMAGTVLRPQVVHPLITNPDAARQRAIAELADSGRLINQTLTLMVLPETGVIKPGTMLRYTDDDGAPRLGLVRGTAINWAFPALTQTITVEGHA